MCNYRQFESAKMTALRKATSKVCSSPGAAEARSLPRAVRRTSGKVLYEAVGAEVKYPDRSVPRLLGELKLDGRLGLQPGTLHFSMALSPWPIAGYSGRFKSPASALSTWMS